MITRTAAELKPDDVVVLYGFEYTIRRTEVFVSGRVGIWLVKPDTFDSVPADTTYMVVSQRS